MRREVEVDEEAEHLDTNLTAAKQLVVTYFCCDIIITP